MVQLSPSYMTTGKTIALTRWTFVGRVTSQLFNRLSRASLVAWLVKNLPTMCLGLIPGLGRSTGEGKGYPLKYSGLENSMDCIVHGVAKLDTTEWLSLSLSKHCNKWEKPHFPVKIFKSKVFSTDEYLLWDSGNSFLQGRCFFFFLS